MLHITLTGINYGVLEIPDPDPSAPPGTMARVARYQDSRSGIVVDVPFSVDGAEEHGRQLLGETGPASRVEIPDMLGGGIDLASLRKKPS